MITDLTLKPATGVLAYGAWGPFRRTGRTPRNLINIGGMDDLGHRGSKVKPVCRGGRRSGDDWEMWGSGGLGGLRFLFELLVDAREFLDHGGDNVPELDPVVIIPWNQDRTFGCGLDDLVVLKDPQ